LAAVLALLGVSVGAFFYLRDAAIPRARLEAKNATPPSRFLILADRARAHVRDRIFSGQEDHDIPMTGAHGFAEAMAASKLGI
jgi:hypothetical protein